MNKKILVLGKSGQLGQEVLQVFSNKEKYDVCAPSETDADVTDFVKLNRIVNEFNPEIIVNCAAYTNVDGCQKNTHLAELVNSVGAQNAANAALRSKAFLVHVSTDYVYNGNTEFKKVSHKTDSSEEQPLNVYGLTKLFGENRIEEQMKEEAPYDYVILRTSGLYGKHGSNFLSKMKIRFLAEKKPLEMICDQWYCPTSALQLARQIKIFSDLSREDREYIFNREGNILNANNVGFTSPYLFLSEYFALDGHSELLKLIGHTTFEKYFSDKNTALRPKAVILKNELAEKYGKELNAFTTIEEALGEYIYKS